MPDKRKRSGIVVAFGAALLLAVGVSSTGPVEAKSQAHNLTGTWAWQAVGATGFNTYGQDGTVTGVSSLIFGTDFSPVPGTLHSTDHGVWRQVGGGFEVAVFRMGFNPQTGDVESITRLRSLFKLDPGRESTSGTFFVAIWLCPSATTCPDPNVDPPDVEEFVPPGNTWTQTRVRLP